jgi:hypothetical protein
MKKRIFHFLGCGFSRKNFSPIFFAIVLQAFALRAGNPPVAQDTTSQNLFAFSSDFYFVDQSETNASIAVEFTPGDRSWSGAVDFYTSNGTARAGIDYQPTNGTLYFSGPGSPVPVVSISILDGEHPSNSTIDIYLSNPAATITRPHATLVIVDKNQSPPLQISPAAFSMILSWPAIYDGYVLERSAGFPCTNWNKIEAIPSTNLNFCFVSDPLTETPSFYRLRKNVSP